MNGGVKNDPSSMSLHESMNEGESRYTRNVKRAADMHSEDRMSLEMQTVDRMSLDMQTVEGNLARISFDKRSTNRNLA